VNIEGLISTIYARNSIRPQNRGNYNFIVAFFPGEYKTDIIIPDYTNREISFDINPLTRSEVIGYDGLSLEAATRMKEKVEKTPKLGDKNLWRARIKRDLEDFALTEESRNLALYRTEEISQKKRKRSHTWKNWTIYASENFPQTFRGDKALVVAFLPMSHLYTTVLSPLKSKTDAEYIGRHMDSHTQKGLVFSGINDDAARTIIETVKIRGEDEGDYADRRMKIVNSIESSCLSL